MTPTVTVGRSAQFRPHATNACRPPNRDRALKSEPRRSALFSLPRAEVAALEPNAAPHYFCSANGESNLVSHHGCFAWYELLTTDVAAAKAFYADVLGWEAREALTSDLPYTLFAAGKVPICGVMELPEEGRRMGASPRWMGYVGVDDIEVTTGRIKHLGGTVFVPPTDTNIGRISVVADPQSAIIALVAGLKFSQQQPLEAAKPGRVGWHELMACTASAVSRLKPPAPTMTRGVVTATDCRGGAVPDVRIKSRSVSPVPAFPLIPGSRSPETEWGGRGQHVRQR